ncbi:MAG: pirin family protein, partial [archaeon]
FNNYYDPQNVQWSTLRVVNEDIIQPAQGFPFHYHENMEIVTYVISGELTHEDSLGNKGSITPNVIQRMSAGTGIEHAEYNASPKTPVHLLQMWVIPQTPDHSPGWEEKKFEENEIKNTPLCVANASGKKGALSIRQNASFWICKLESGKTISFKPEYSHQYVMLIDGKIELNGNEMHPHDAARIAGEKSLSMIALTDCHVVWWDLQSND